MIFMAGYYPTPGARVRTLVVNAPMLRDFFAARFPQPGLEYESDFPPDAEIVGIAESPRAGVIRFLIYSQTFEPLMPGATPPEMDVIFRSHAGRWQRVEPEGVPA